MRSVARQRAVEPRSPQKAPASSRACAPAARGPGIDLRSIRVHGRDPRPKETPLGVAAPTLAEDLPGVRMHFGIPFPLGAVGVPAAARHGEIAFRATRPTPELVAHELIHVMQFRNGSPSAAVTRRDDAAEREAATLAPRVARGERVEPRAKPTGALALGEGDPTIPYVVQKGDTLWTIAGRFAPPGVDRTAFIEQIKALNKLQSDALQVGQTLQIPSQPAGQASEAPGQENQEKKEEAPPPPSSTATTSQVILYTVKSGDSLWKIAGAHLPSGVTHEAFIVQIKAVNGLESDALQAGQTLKIPAPGAVATEEAPATSSSDTVIAVPKMCRGAAVPDKGSFGNKVALTFDDGPHKVNTPNVLAILAKHKALATFFINGKNVPSQDPDGAILKSIRDQGHTVGNHTQSHDNLGKASTTVVQDQIKQTDKYITESDKMMRFPFGAAGCAQIEAAQALGYKVVGWHVDSADWCYGDDGVCSNPDFAPTAYKSDMKGLVLKQVKANKGGVVLFHDTQSHTVNHLDAIMTALEAEGYTWTTLGDVATFPLLNAQPTTR